eukprot:1630991-Amphidinium_carterae.1
MGDGWVKDLSAWLGDRCSCLMEGQETVASSTDVVQKLFQQWNEKVDNKGAEASDAADEL